MNLEGTITDENVLKTPVGALPFPTRARRIFREFEIENIEQLLKIPDEDLISVRGFYHDSLRQTKQVVADYASTPTNIIYCAEKLGKKERTIQQIRELASQGLTREEIAEKAGRSYNHILKLISEEKIKVRRAPIKTDKIRPEIDRMIVEGKSLCEMGDVTEQTRERMRQYINARNAHDYWRKQREKRKRRKNFEKEKITPGEIRRRDIIGNIVREVLEHAVENEEDFAARKTGEYFLAHPRARHSREQLESVFRIYHEAEQRGKVLSLKEISKKSKSEIMFPKIGEILHSVGLEPMNGSNEKSSDLSPEEVNAIWRVRNVKMPNTDLAYFVGRNFWNIWDRFRKMEIERPKIKNQIKRFGWGGSQGFLSYALASQIYEARDAGYFKEFSEDEMAGFFDTSKKVIDYALQNRDKIAPQISTTLKLIYPKRKSNKPYRTAGDVFEED